LPYAGIEPEALDLLAVGARSVREAIATRSDERLVIRAGRVLMRVRAGTWPLSDPGI